MAAGFGEQLRLRREAQHIDLTAIAEQTKIKRSLLEALERDDLSQWPGGIFRRAWLRTYAKAIGLDPDTTVREFLEAHPDPEDLPIVPPAPGDAPVGDSAASPRFRGIVGAALGSLSRRMRGPQAEERDSVAPVPAFEPRIAPSPHPKADVSLKVPVDPLPVAKGDLAPQDEPLLPATVDPVPPVRRSAPYEFDLAAVARLCTRFGQVVNAKEVQPLLQELATLLDAAGLIVWVWHAKTASLRPALVHGYSAGVVSRLPVVSRDDDNPTAASFRAAEAREIDGSGDACGALVLPLLLRSRCVGVLAIELQPGRELTDAARAVATIAAAAIAQLVGRSQPVEAKTPASPSRRQRLSPVQGSV